MMNDHFWIFARKKIKTARVFLFFLDITKFNSILFIVCWCLTFFPILRYVCSIEYFHQKGNSKILFAVTNLCLLFISRYWITEEVSIRMIDRLATDMYFYFKLYNLAILLYSKYTFLSIVKKTIWRIILGYQ